VSEPALRVEEAGPLTTVQDLGRPGFGSLGVPESGALDPRALTLANRLVGNPEDAAGLELTFGGLRLTVRRPVVLAVTGAPVLVTVDDAAAGLGCAVPVPAGSSVRLGSPRYGVRSYLALRGGVQADRLLGSASTDLLAGIGAPLADGDDLDVGATPDTDVPVVDPAPLSTPTGEDLVLRVVLGPRDDWFTDEALDLLLGSEWTVESRSNRIGVRLTGPTLHQRRKRELPSEGTIAGSLQVPHNGQPTLFLADHPITGGYPVIAVVHTADLPHLAQARPTQLLRFRQISAPHLPEQSVRDEKVEDQG
jgi:biotin-dependent carboxylase-like uncharacterized protein